MILTFTYRCLLSLTKIALGFFFVLGSLTGQNSGIVKYNLRLNFGNLKVRITETEADLHFKDSVSLFTYRKAFLSSTTSPNAKLIKEIFLLEISGSSARKNIIELDSIGFQVYHDFANSEVIFREVSSWDSFIIKEPIDGPEWVLTDVESMKQGYQCLKATCHFRGRKYTAWFTIDIPLSLGPWKFHGLPGLIVEVESDDGEVLFYLTDFGYSDNVNIAQPMNGQIVTFEQYWQQYLVDYQARVDFLREQSSGADSIRRSRGATGDYFKEPNYYDNIDIPPFSPHE